MSLPAPNGVRQAGLPHSGSLGELRLTGQLSPLSVVHTRCAATTSGRPYTASPPLHLPLSPPRTA
jgi:hypothetical protein